MPQPQSPPSPVREGSRWRFHKPSGEEVAEWFRGVPLDDGMKHEDFVSGIVVIPASEKIRRLKADGRGTEEVYEQTFTPYCRVDTRVTYFRKLAELRELIAVIEPVSVPRLTEGAFKNDNLPEGYFWHIAGESANAERFLCCTQRVALYEPDRWYSEKPVPLREGRATKSVTGRPDINGLLRAETSAIGRALAVAGILVLGTGLASADDMAELRESGASVDAVALPAAGAGEETEEQLNERLGTLEIRLRPYTDAWREFTAWWAERAKASGWQVVRDAPVEARKGVASKIEQMLAEQPEAPPAPEPEPAEAVTEA